MLRLNIFVRGLQAATTALVSIDNAGARGNSNSQKHGGRRADV